MSGISPACHDLDLFFDGELAESAATAYRDHLADCDRCQRMLRGRVLEAVAVSKAAAAPAIPLRPPAKRRWVWAGAGVAALVAACVALWLHRVSPHAAVVPDAVAAAAVVPLRLELAAQRDVDVRFSTASLDAHRPSKTVMRSAPEPGSESFRPESFNLDSLAALEKRAPNALVAALALEGRLEKAGERAKKLPNTAASLSDRAALALLEPGDPQKSQANTERALSLARQALRITPTHTQAMWNEAVALERLQLTLAAADTFSAIAERGEPGWATEAKDRAAELRKTYRSDIDQRKPLLDAAIAMIRDGAPMVRDHVSQDASLAEVAFHLTVASTADRERLAALAPLAEQLDLAPELAQIRASNLAARAPLAREIANISRQLSSLVPARAPVTLAGFSQQVGSLLPLLPEDLSPNVRDALRALRGRAKAAGHADIARAIWLLIDAKYLTDVDVDELRWLSEGSRWWRLVAVQRHTFYLSYLAGSLENHHVDAVRAAQDVVGSCDDHIWCPSILTSVAASSSEIGQLDDAYKLAVAARRLTQKFTDRMNEGRVMYTIGQVLARRVAADFDAGAIGDAYAREAALRFENCAWDLARVDLRAAAALDYHRFADAELLLREAERYQSTCRKDGTQYNRDEVRFRLIAHRPAADLVEQLEQRAQSKSGPENALYNEFLRAVANHASANDEASAGRLRQVIAKIEVSAGAYQSMTLDYGYSALAEWAARRGASSEALATIAARLDVQLEPGCVVAVNHYDRITIVVRGADNQVASEIRYPAEGQRLIAAPELISRAMLARLAGCRSVEVLAAGAYFGAANLLPGEHRWTYRSSPRRRAPRSSTLSPEVVVSDVEPPRNLRLPKLRVVKSDPSARVVSGAAATPKGALAAIKDAELVRFKVHGITDVHEPSAARLVLSPDSDGAYELTAAHVEKAQLTGAPVIILEACHAGRVQVSMRPWSLASSFLAAGARAVIAPTVEIPDDVADMVFGSIVERMRRGKSPEQAVAEEREARGDVPWLASVVVFQ